MFAMFGMSDHIYMMKGLSTLLSLCVALLTGAAAFKPSATSYPTNSNEWQRQTPPDPSQQLTVKLRLPGEHFDELTPKMLDISKTRSAWLTSEELSRYVAPAAKDKTAVQAFLADHGVAQDNIHLNGFENVWTVKADVATVSKMFDTTIQAYKHDVSGATVIQGTDVKVPEGLQVTVEGLTPAFVTPRYGGRRYRSNSVDNARRDDVPAAAPSVCQDKNVSFACLAELYGTNVYSPKPNSESAAVILFDAFKDETILAFERNIHPAANGYIPNKLYLGPSTGGWDNVTETVGEAAFDIEALIGLAYPLNLTFFFKNLSQDSSFYTEMFQELIEIPDADRPGIVSLSFGVTEQDWPAADGIAMCAAAQQLAALGTTLVVAAGDYGVEVIEDKNKTCPPFRSDFTSGCPYIVSVGATQNPSNERAAYDDREPDVANGWSSGGFSNRFAMPDFQVDAVKTYLSQIDPSLSKYFNSTGRASVDISALGSYIWAWFDDGGGLFGGTSASAPISAAILALVNAKCKESGKPRIGWAHPTLYSHAEAFNDITKGGEYGCAKTDLGFPCKTGWDPATGLGSPNFSRLVTAFGC